MDNNYHICSSEERSHVITRYIIIIVVIIMIIHTIIVGMCDRILGVGSASAEKTLLFFFIFSILHLPSPPLLIGRLRCQGWYASTRTTTKLSSATEKGCQFGPI